MVKVESVNKLTYADDAVSRHELESFQVQRLPTPATGPIDLDGADWSPEPQDGGRGWLSGLATISHDLSQKLARRAYRVNGGGSVGNLVVGQGADDSIASLLNMLPPLPSTTGALGWTDDGQPLLATFQDAALPHVLLSSEDGVGATQLLNHLLLTLAALNRESQVQMLLIDGQAEAAPIGLSSLDFLPHLIVPTIDTVPDAVEALRFLVTEMEYRQLRRIRSPMTLAVIHGLDELINSGGRAIIAPIAKCLSSGPAVGLHLLLTTRQPARQDITGLLQNEAVMRLVGQLDSHDDLAAATGLNIEPVDYQLQGDEFVAVVGGEVTPFYCPFVSPQDHEHVSQLLTRRYRGALLVQPVEKTVTTKENTVNEGSTRGGDLGLRQAVNSDGRGPIGAIDNQETRAKALTPTESEETGAQALPPAATEGSTAKTLPVADREEHEVRSLPPAESDRTGPRTVKRPVPTTRTRRGNENRHVVVGQ